MLTRQKEWLVNLMPDSLFAFITNLRNQKLYGEGIRISRTTSRGLFSYWLIKRGAIELHSPTSKMTSFGMAFFEDKFERYFNIERGDTVLDVGACIGDTTVPMALKTNGGKIIAIEPHPENLKYLQRNLVEFPKVIVFRKAVSNKAQLTELYTTKAITGHSLIPSSRHKTDTYVLCDSLDGILKEIQIDFAKIDIQGAEVSIFSSCPRFLSTVKKLVVETHHYFDPKRRTLPAVLSALRPWFSEIIADQGVVYCQKK